MVSNDSDPRIEIKAVDTRLWDLKNNGTKKFQVEVIYPKFCDSD